MNKIIRQTLLSLFCFLLLIIAVPQRGQGANPVCYAPTLCNGVEQQYRFGHTLCQYCGNDMQCLCDRRHLGTPVNGIPDPARDTSGVMPTGPKGPQGPAAPTAPGNPEPGLRRSLSQFFSWFTLAVATTTGLLLGWRWWRRRAFAWPVRARLWWRQPRFSGVAVALFVTAGVALMLLFPTLTPSGKRGRVSAREQAHHQPFLPGRAGAPQRKAAERALALAGANPSPADQFTAAFGIGGNGITQIGAAGYDTSGNLYVTGGFTGTLELTVNAQSVTLTASKDMDFFLAKFNANNQCQWVRTASGAANLPSKAAIEGAIALAVDAQGNCYVGGGFVGSLIFKDSQGTPLATLSDNNNDINVEPFVAKFSATGEFAWAQGGNSGSPDGNGDAQHLLNNTNAVTEIVVDGAGNPYVAGLTGGERFLGTSFQGRGKADVVLARLQPANGNVTWLQSAGGSASDGALGLAIDNAANVYLIGFFNDIARFPTQPASFYDSLGYEDTFVSKFDANGQCQWVKQIGGEFDVAGNSIAVDENGDLYLTGSYFGKATFGTTKFNSPDYVASFLAKMNADCQVLWARSSGGTADTYGDRVTLDRQGQVFVLGVFENYDEEDFATALFGAESLADPVGIQTEDGDLFLAKYTRDGTFRWARGVYGTGDMAGCEVCTDEISLGYLPLRLIKHPVTNDLQLFGDFQGMLTLSDNNLTTDLTSEARVGFVAKLMHTCPPLAFSALPNAQVNQIYSAKITLSGGESPTRFNVESAASLPPGLTLAADGTLSGTPTQPGTYTLKINGADAYDCTGSNTYQITVSTYEGDVAPRPHGSGSVSVSDWVQAGRFVIGLDMVNEREFQRLDCAPRATGGDGQVTLTDWVQAGRYAIGLDGKVYAAGPGQVSFAPIGLSSYSPRTATLDALAATPRRVRAIPSTTEANTMLVAVDALGTEAAVGFSLQFDPTVLRLAEAVTEIPGGAVLLNDRAMQQGTVGIAFSLPTGQALRAGTATLLKLRFLPVETTTATSTPLRFTSAPLAATVVDAEANALVSTFTDAALPVLIRSRRSPGRDTSQRGSSTHLRR